MSIDLYAAKIVAEVLAERQSLEVAYRNFPDSNLYFMMVDLVQSTNYRLKNGPERGYIRGESFFSMMRASVRPYTEIRVFKEIGDAVLICSTGFRPLFEVALLLTHATKQLSFATDDPSIPFEVRIGIDFGLAKRLTRHSEDYLGEVIDRLARLMSIRSENTNLVVGEQALDINRQILKEYEDICSISQPLRLNLPQSKAVVFPIVYYELNYQPGIKKSFSDFFSEWKR